MKKTFLFIVLAMFISAIGVIFVTGAEPHKDKTRVKDMQSRKLFFKGRQPEEKLVTQGAAARAKFKKPQPEWSSAVAFDSSPTLRELSKLPYDRPQVDKPEDMGFRVRDKKFSGDDAVQTGIPSLTIPSTAANFEGLSNNDNFSVYGGRVNPPDNMGDVGPNHYFELINLVGSVYDKNGNQLIEPFPIGALWSGFAIDDCTDPSGDPVVLYDQHVNRWILTQFTTSGLFNLSLPFYNCVAVSQTPDPLGSYYRYAFTSGFYFPDYPKYGVWTDSYVLTSRDFGPNFGYGISVYALEKAKMISGNPNARAVKFFLEAQEDDGTFPGPVALQLVGDGLLPADWDGTRRPQAHAPIPIVGTMDDGAGYGATYDAINVFNLSVLWNSQPWADFDLANQLSVAAFDSIFPCGPSSSRDCLPQPGIVSTLQYLDVLSYRQRPIHRLAYRNFGFYEAMVTNQSVEASAGLAGTRWYEIRRTRGNYSIYQQGTYAPADGIHRWMGSVAQDKKGNIALGYSVVDGTSVYPGIRYTGRLSGDTLGQMTLGEGTVIDGSGVQTTTNSRWGDYTSLNIDPNDDCTFWYVNEYYTPEGQASSTAGWQTRIASFKLPGCN